MDVVEAIRERRSIRVYKTTPIDDKTIETILEAGRLAPSWGNSQTWCFIVVKDSGVKALLAENALRLGNRGTNAVKIAPVVIAACAELNKAGFLNATQTSQRESARVCLARH